MTTMDFETPAGNEFDSANLQPSGGDAPPAAPRGPDRVLTPNAQGVVVLPAGAGLEDVQVEGRNLVIVTDDGTRYVIVDGAIIVPQLEAEGVAVPPINLAALLVGNEPQPAAGNPQSSGNNFSRAVGPIQDAYGLGDLLPYTELLFPQNPDEEIIPDVVDRDPGTLIITPNNPAGAVNATASVNEAGLPARGNEPPGSNAASDSETTTGTIVYTAPDGLDTISLNGVPITAVGQTFAGSFGMLRITSIAPGAIGYSYTLADNTLTGANEVYMVTVLENDGDTASAALTITIVDDVPTARSDTDTVPAATYTGESGNVFTGVGTTSGSAGADTPGADGATVSGIVAGTGTAFVAPGGTINGQYGTLTINAAGGYTYTRNAGTPGGVNDVFTYRLTDGDGDTSTATLTITITDSPATITAVPTLFANTGVFEAGLPARGNESPGSNDQAPSESVSGSITYAAPDGIASVQINGVTVTGAGQIIQLPNGTLRIDLFDIATGRLDYTFTLTDNTSGDNFAGTVIVTVTDLDGDTDSKPFTLTVVDDVPTARADVDDVGENGPIVADGNVITGSGGSDVNATDGVADTPGADGAAVTGVAAGSNTANPVSGNVGSSVTGTYGSLTINANGTYSYTLNANAANVQALANGDVVNDVFVYTITDGDGDTSTTTVTIRVTGADSPVVITGLDGRGAEEIVDEDDLSDGSSPNAAALTQTGTFSIDSQDGLATLTVNGTTIFGAGVVYPVTIVTGYRTLTITGVTTTTNPGGEVITATVSYSYTLNDNTLLHTGGNEGSLTESFAVVATDTDGSSDTESLDITVIDDVPTANPDTNSGVEGAVLTGNVVTDNDDVPGADSALVTGVATGSNTANPVSGNVGSQIQGTYGKLTLNADGSYSYDGDPNTVPQGGATDTFVYTITDGDGDTSTTTLTITLTDGNFPVSDNDAVVNEAGLNAGSDANASSEIFNGTITPGGGTSPYTYTLTSSATGTYGTLVLNANGTYTYTLTSRYDTSPDNDNSTNTEQDRDTFTYTVTDANGNTTSGSILVDIVDDVPTAYSNTNNGAEGAILTGNVLTDGLDDVFGADGPAAGGGVTGVATGSNTANPVSGNVGVQIQGTYGKLTLNADGSYSYDGDPNTVPPAGATDTFVYTIKDGDGDTSTTTLTITLTDASFPVSDTDATVNEKGLAAGGSGENADGIPGNNSDTTETTTGAITPGGGTGPYTYTLTSPAAGAYGTLTLNADGTYSYTLTSRYDTNPDADNSTNTEDNRDSFTYTVTDALGNTSGGTIFVDIVDDVPTASSNTNNGVEGAILTGNVLTDGIDDVFGADGAAAGGGVTGVATGSNTTNPVSGNVGSALQGTYGKLTLNADGSYSYDGDPNTVPPAGATDTFVYTIKDGDGDTSTTTLTITLTDGNFPVSDTDATVNEKGLAAGGSGENADGNAGNNSDTSETTTGSITPGGGTGPYTYTLTSSATGTYGTLTLNADGTYSYTLTSRYDTNPDADNSTNTEDNRDSFTYTVTDANGNTSNGTILVDIVDDVPTASSNSNSGVEGAILTGNVLTDGTDDVFGADGKTVPAGGVTGVATGSNTTNPVSGNVGSALQGTYGKLTLNADGSYSYDGDPNTVPPAGGTDTFVYTIKDGDGDTSTTTLTITLTNGNFPVSDTDATVNEKGLAAGGSGENADSNAGNNSDTTETTTGSITPGGGTGPYTYTLTSSATGTYGTLTLNADGTYSYTLTSRYDTNPDADNSTNTEQDRDTFNYTVTDANGNTTTGSILVDIVDDVPTANSNTNSVAEGAIVAGNVLTDGTDDVFGADGKTTPAGGVTGVAIGSNTAAPVSGNVGVQITGTYGKLTLNADGSYSYDANPNIITTGTVVDHFVYTIKDGDGDTSTTTLDITINNVTVTASDTDATVNEKGLAANGSGELADGNAGNNSDTSETTTGSITPSGGSGTYTYALTSSAVGTYGTLTLNADGTYSYTLTSRYDTNPDANNSTNTEQDRDTFNYTVTDSNGNTATGSILVDIVDDVPSITSHTDLTLTGSNLSGSGDFEYLIGADSRTSFSALNSDFIIDLSGTVGASAITSPTVTWQSESATAAEFDFSFYYDSNPNDPLNLPTLATGTITFDKVNDSYQFTLDAAIQSYTTNQTANTFARVDYNLSGPASQSEYVVSQLGETNPIFVRFKGIEASDDFGGADTTFTAGDTFQGTDSYVTVSGDSNGVSGDTIQGQGGEVLNVDLFTSDPGVPDQTAGYTASPNAFATGITLRLDLVGNDTDFVVILKLADPNNPTVILTTRAIIIDPTDIYKQGDTIPTGYTLSSPLESNDGFVIIESNDYLTGVENYVIVGFQLVASTEGTTGTGIDHNRATGVAGASTLSDTFAGHDDNDVVKITDIGLIRVITTTEALHLDFDVAIVDADGDVTSEVTISINPLTPPIVLDLDGDGVEFVGTAAGVTYDYDNDGTPNATAWAGADDGVLAIDLDGNGQISGREVVFGGNGMTDLEGLAAKYDSNDDGVLDANDAAFAQFGVLQGGQFTSLSQAGIASIGLTSDGQGYTAADGEVIVHGTGTYTRADGSTGSLADAAFATDRRTAETAVVTAAAGALLAPELAAASDTKATADEPVAREVPTDVDTAPAASIDTADGFEANDLSDLLDTSDASAPAADTGSLHTQDEPDTAVAFDQLEDGGNRIWASEGGSDPVADFSVKAPGSNGGFGGDDGQLMDALLAIGNGAGALQTQDFAPVAEAFAEFNGTASVDAIVNHFAGAVGTVAFDGMGSNMLLDALDASIFTGLAMHGPDTIDEAAQLAATVQA